jgi:Tfp pilus assembly protein PilN
MNAVNLIPADSRTRRMALRTSPLTLGLVGLLVVALIGALVYVQAVNTVTARRSQLARITSATAAWNAAAARYGVTVEAVQRRSQELADVHQLAAGRFPWSVLLRQIGTLLPTDAALTTMQAATSTGTASSTPSATTGAGGASTADAGAAGSPTVQLSGCAGSQPAVAQTMVALHRIDGVSAVTLGSSSSASGGGAGNCAGKPVQFQMSLSLKPTAAASLAAGNGNSASTPPVSTTPAATAAAKPSTTGATQ